MNDRGRINTTTLIFIVGLLATVALVVGLVLWMGDRPGRPAPPPQAQPASGELMAVFDAAVAALDAEENDRAARLLIQATDTAPEEPALWANLGLAYLRIGERQKAEAALDRAAQLAPEAPQIIVLRALLAERQGDFDRAIEHLRHAHQVEPENAATVYALASTIARRGQEEAEEEQLRLLGQILEQHPGNLRVRAEQARLAAKLGREAQLQDALAALDRAGGSWPEGAEQQFETARAAAERGDDRAAAAALAFFENLIKPLPAYQEGLADLGLIADSVGLPVRRLLRLAHPYPQAAPADSALTFEMTPVPTRDTDRPDLVRGVALTQDTRPAVLTLEGDRVTVGDAVTLAYPGSTASAGPASVLVADLNNDFHQDLILVGSEGVRLALQTEDGQFEPVAGEVNGEPAAFREAWAGAWAIDVDADGDLDLVLASEARTPQLMRNNGDMTFTPLDALAEALPVRQLVWTDLDREGTPDLVLLHPQGEVSAWLNRRGGRFEQAATLPDVQAAAVAVGDLDRDGRFEVVVLDRQGTLRSYALDERGQWERRELARWEDAPDLAQAWASGRVDLWVADLDNNGALDLLATAGGQAVLWLGEAQGGFARTVAGPSMFVTSVLDLDQDGLLDLVGMSEQGGQVAHNRSEAGYRWQIVAPQATPNAGDQRINSFGIGGRVEIRAGALVQAAQIQGVRVHFGLGQQEEVSVVRIVWPNGVAQAEFDLEPNGEVIARQRLKGSCPWVFAYDGQEFVFIKDFIWRSPLGLRINAQETAGVMQTEDWITIPGDQLANVEGQLQLRITAELWETHFFDHVALAAVDHPMDIEALVDERFVPTESPQFQVVATHRARPLAGVWDHHGQSVQDAVQAADGKYVDTFELGRFQGVAEAHWVEFELPNDVPADGPVVLVGQGWIYPTDSSLNVAMGQGEFDPPYGLILEQRQTDGSWRTVKENLGFPAGKNKTVLIPLPDPQPGTRWRLRTNLEIYWDSLGWTVEAEPEALRFQPLQLQVADLRYRGFSELSPVDRRRPDLPDYQRLAGTQQRWRDLEGYYTRFGDVRELLAEVDDRYVIMNAGDEMVLVFQALDPPQPGWQRNYVLIGDGWVKDGDYNTAFSQFIRPLPSHADSAYAGPLRPLTQDPVYQRHPDDWRRFHTRYVTPRSFERGLWPLAPASDIRREPQP